MRKQKSGFTGYGSANVNTVPFDSAEEVWFWFIQAQQARNDGARMVAGSGLYNRPCEPVDVLKILDSLYRKRRLTRDHLLVLRHYGRRNMPPDRRRPKEVRASYLWEEAIERMEPVFESKGILRAQSWVEKQDTKNTKYHAIENVACERMAAE